MWSLICEALFPKKSVAHSQEEKILCAPNLDYRIALIPDKPEDTENTLISFVWSPPGG